jgi:hypothetical protein
VRKRNLRSKNCLLHGNWRFVMIVIKANLTDGDYAWLLGKLMELIKPGGIVSRLRVIGLDTDYGPAVGRFVGELNSPTGRRQIVAYLTKLSDPVRFHALKDQWTVVVELRAIEMAVGIKKAQIAVVHR